jgi:signal transduction histidine kinase
VETPIRVLIADDTDDIRLLLRSALERDGRFVVVAEATDGVESIREAARHHPDAIILDLAMPLMDGLEAIPAIRRRSPKSRIVVLSVFPAERMASQVLEAGADAYLEKTDIPRLIPILASIVGEAAAAPPATAPTMPPEVQPAASVDPPSELLQALAHELMSPTTVIMRMAETVRSERDDLPEETIDRFLDSIIGNATHMAELIESLAEAHRVDAGMLALDPRPTDIGSLVEQTVSDMGSVLERHTVETSLPTGIVASVDPVRVRQILTNLMTNAAKFSPEGTTVSVALAEAGEDVEISVTDQGPGLPPGSQEAAFEKFSRLSSTQRGGGLGLGLYIARGIARAHGGDLTASSGPGAGARFRFRLPGPAGQPG